MDIHGCLWMPTDINGYPWTSMNMNESVGNIHGHPWISMDIPEYAFGVHGYP